MRRSYIHRPRPRRPREVIDYEIAINTLGWIVESSNEEVTRLIRGPEYTEALAIWWGDCGRIYSATYYDYDAEELFPIWRSMGRLGVILALLRDGTFGTEYRSDMVR